MLIEMKFVCGTPDNRPGWQKGGFEFPTTSWDNMREASRVGHTDAERLFDDTREIWQRLDLLFVGTCG
jgi:hypothetical protein